MRSSVARQVIGQLVPLPLGAEQALQLRGGAAIRRIDVHRLAQRPDRAAAAVQLLLVQLRAAAQQRQLRRRVDGAPRLLVDQLAQLLPRAPALQRRLEQLRDVAIVGARVEQAAVVLLRLGPLAQTVVEDLRGAADDVEHRRLLAQLALEVARRAGSPGPAQRSSLSARRTSCSRLRRSVGASWNTLPYQRRALS